MLKKISTSELNSLKDNFVTSLPQNPEGRAETISSIVTLDELQDFINQAGDLTGCDGARIYFIRYDNNQFKGANPKHIKKLPGKNLSQVSMAFVPVNISDRSNWLADDILSDNNTTVLTLAFCHPEFDDPLRQPPVPQATGHCPPIGNCR